ncbi:YihY/virulence factor BrkB family protein [Deinococcus sp. YIM 134068]|uniref:YihY/virulence factor BrkB family protein n=1 Tax=Deinococcus lichenicola TaxID=3118910 RepID=UPI002F948E6E
MKLKLADLFTLIREAALAFGQDKAPRLAAAIAYYALFSLAPLLLFAVAVAGFFLSDETVVTNLLGPESLLALNLGEQAASFLRELIANQEGLQRGSLIATVLGFVTLFLGATGLFVQLQDALNSLWGADPPPPQGALAIVKSRVLSFVLILVIGLVLLAFLGLNTYLASVAQQLGDIIGAGAIFVRLGTLALGVGLLTLVFAAVYKVLPSVRLEWREVWVGSAVTAVLFTLGQLAIGLYLGRAAPGSVFGAAASLVILMLWLYYSGMIFFFGAEVTWVYSQKYGTRAGGAANVGKKEAVAARGADISTQPSGQEQAAAESASPAETVRDSRGRVLGLPLPRRGHSASASPRPSAPPRERRLTPGVGAALWNAVSAVLALPVVIVLRLVGLGRRKKG